MYRYLLLALMCVFFNTAAQPVDARKVGAELTAAFYSRRLDTVWERLDAGMRDLFKSKDGLAAFREQVGTQLGAEQAVLDESVSTQPNASVYKRRARFEKFSGAVLVQWTFAGDGKVAAFMVAPDQNAPKPPAPSEHLDYRTKTALRLPFGEEFVVAWGGRTVEQNYHASNANQRFAYDLLIVRDNATHAGDGRRNEDYFCFDKRIVAPAAGKVIDAVGDIEDNIPGEMNKNQVAGNRVIIDHGNGEFSLLAHFRKDSLRVKRGERVKAGEHLGDCGNSGHSSEPHLHYQLQDGPEFGSSAGLPAQFVNYVADGAPVARGEPAKGQRIRPATKR